MSGFFSPADEARIDENVADLVEAGEDIDVETVSATNNALWRLKRSRRLISIIEKIRRLPTDTKAVQLSWFSMS